MAVTFNPGANVAPAESVNRPIAVQKSARGEMPRRLFLAFWLVFVAAAPAWATTVLPLYLDDIIGQAAIAFQGRCVANQSVRDPETGLAATLTTFQVDEVLKGDVPATYTIKQVGGELPQERLHFKVPGVPSFTVGESYVVFLAGVSDKGFSSPIGLEQGKFTVLPGAQEPEVANGRDFKEMTARLPAGSLPPTTKSRMRQAPGAVRRMGLQEFKQLVRQQLAAGQ
jgi:hypothetical protein